MFEVKHSTRSISEKLEQHTFKLLIFIVFWAPIPLASNRPWAWGLLEILSYSLFVISFWCNKYYWRVKLRAHLIPIACFSFFVIWNCIQLLPLSHNLVSLISPNLIENYAFGNVVPTFVPISTDPGQTLISLYKSLGYWCLFISVLLLCNSNERIKQLMLAIIFTGIFQAMYGASEILSGIDKSIIFNLPVKSAATGTFVYKNHYANFLMLCLSIGIGFLVSTLVSTSSRSRQRIRELLVSFLSTKALVRIGLAIMVVALVMSHSRMGNTAFFSAMTIVGTISLILNKKRNRGLLVLIVSLLIIDTLIVSTWFGLDKLRERVEQTSIIQEKRDEVIIDSLQIVSDFKITGTGLGSFYSVYPAYQSDDVNAFYDHAHNDYLQFIIEAGATASFTISLIPLIVLSRCTVAFRKRRNTLIRGLAFGCMMAVLGMLIHISVDFPLQAPANCSVFCIILALGLLTKKSNHKSHHTQ